MALRAVIFDMDGTLTDSEEWWDEVRRGLAADENIAWPQSATTAMMGMSTPEWATYLTEVVGLSGTPKQAAARTIAGMQSRYQAGVPLLPGADEIVRAAAQHWPIAICSSSPRVLIDAVAAAMGWDELLVATVSTEEVGAGKPAPDGYLLAANKLGIDPADCLVFEDSTNGTRSALSAGMKVIVALPEFNPPVQEILDQCNLVVNSLTEVTPEIMASLF